MRIVTLTAMALVLGSMPLLAQETAAPMAPRAAPVLDFAAADADGNGAVSPEEWRAYTTAQMTARRDARLDAHVDRIFDAGDADGNDALDRDEMRTALTTIGDEMRERMGDRGERGHRGGHHGGRHGHGHGGGDGEGREMGQRGDRGDGEGRGRGGRDRAAGMERFTDRAFDRIDRDNDGMLSAEEFETAQERMTERWAERMERRTRATN